MNGTRRLAAQRGIDQLEGVVTRIVRHCFQHRVGIDVAVAEQRQFLDLLRTGQQVAFHALGQQLRRLC